MLIEGRQEEHSGRMARPSAGGSAARRQESELRAAAREGTLAGEVAPLQRLHLAILSEDFGFPPAICDIDTGQHHAAYTNRVTWFRGCANAWCGFLAVGWGTSRTVCDGL